MSGAVNLHGFDIRHLSVLDVLFSERHVGRAAQRLNLSQPAVSNSLKWLRQFFEDPLLVRRSGQLHLTPFAERLRDPVRRVLLDVRMVATQRPTFEPSKANNRFRIVMSDHMMTLIMTPILQAATREAPSIRLEFLDLAGDVNAFSRGEVDLVVVPEERLYAQHPRERLFEDRWVCVTCVQCSRWENGLSEEDYRGARHLVPLQPHSIVFQLAELGIERDVAASIPYALIPDALAGTDWIATIPEGVIRHRANRDRFRIHEPPFPTKPYTIGQQWHFEAQDDVASIWLRTKVREAVSQVQPVASGIHKICE